MNYSDVKTVWEHYSVQMILLELYNLVVQDQTDKKKMDETNKNTGNSDNPINKLGLMERYRTVFSVTGK